MKTKVLIISGIILLIALVAVPRLAGTGRYVTADEPTWQNSARISTMLSQTAIMRGLSRSATRG